MRRPSFRDDTYHWVEFALERRTASGVSEGSAAVMLSLINVLVVWLLVIFG